MPSHLNNANDPPRRLLPGLLSFTAEAKKEAQTVDSNEPSGKQLDLPKVDTSSEAKVEEATWQTVSRRSKRTHSKSMCEIVGKQLCSVSSHSFNSFFIF